MARISVARSLAVHLTGGLLVIAGVLTSCAYTDNEPGLFGRSTDPTTVAPSQPATSTVTPPSHIGDELPVVGEAIWTSGDGHLLQLRIAVHSVRRIPGGTVLDWSLTPLRGSGLRAGDAVPPGVRLGLTSDASDPSIFLVDAYGEQVYRPLAPDPVSRGAARPTAPRCLCTPLDEAQRHLVIGQSRLLQVTFPPLTDGLATVDVDIATVPMFWHVPVTGVGQVPVVTNPVDLARAAEVAPLGTSTPIFGYGPDRQRFVVSVDAVLASGSFTSVQWTVQSVTAGAGLESAKEPPFAAGSGTPGRPVDPAAASGLLVRPVAGDLSSKRMATVRLMSVAGAGRDAVQCLCTQLGDWASSLAEASQQVSLVTNVAGLPRGTRTVDVVLPGVSTLKGVPVTTAPDASTRSAGPVVALPDSWTSRPRRPVTGWPVDRWPTPLPDVGQLSQYRATVEVLVR